MCGPNNRMTAVMLNDVKSTERVGNEVTQRQKNGNGRKKKRSEKWKPGCYAGRIDSLCTPFTIRRVSSALFFLSPLTNSPIRPLIASTLTLPTV
ncbi:unnamed protein product [Protopolystoma xenopodis]|uniref:Uncharacterized protein n=1 Tax=Protopolystoma xenopodis TaxID=117903 RepID=A0A448WP31_9PLAT|nr:unnamed protein product [Protopolystoma xenopodis]